jgi:hypothetical protein
MIPTNRATARTLATSLTAQAMLVCIYSNETTTERQVPMALTR